MPANDDSFFRLLCVDDNAMLLQTLAMGFRSYGFDVVTAAHGIDALIQFQAHDGKFGAVLTDHDMPKMNGPALVKKLRALDYRGRILVMSGRITAADGLAYQDLKVSGFLSKPFEIDMMATMLLQSDA
jgi:DNA-binding response OmpR family regulator